MNLPCEILNWDTEFFGFLVARVTSENLALDQINIIDEWCIMKGVKCLYFLANSNDPLSISNAECSGFHLADLRITYYYNYDDKEDFEVRIFEDEFLVRDAESTDIPRLKIISRKSHTNTRFSNDKIFPKHKSRQLYETWIDKSCNGYADKVFVAELNCQPIGYISCHLDKVSASGQIGLFAVDIEFQKRGVGSLLLQRSLEWFKVNKFTDVTVVTQGSNIKVQRLFQKLGLRTSNVQLWYHKWY